MQLPEKTVPQTLGAGTAAGQERINAFLTAVLDRSYALDAELPALAPLRRRARDALQQSGLPEGKLETFKYTPIVRFYRDELVRKERSFAPMSLSFEGHEPAPAGLSVGRLVTPPSWADPLLGQLGRYVDHERHPLAHVNASLVQDGVMIRVARGRVIEAPLQVIHSRGGAPVTRMLVVLEAGAELTLIEHDRREAATSRVAEVVLGEGAQLRHVRVQPRARAATWTLVSADVGTCARYRHRVYAAGGTPRRNDLHVRIDGNGAEVDLMGAFVSSGKDALDNQVVVEHRGTHGTSRHRFHAIAAGSSELTFNGRIHIHPGARKTDAELRTMNLLADAGARINSKPELEIYNDDVKCAHGATIGQVDEAALFYLQSRGIDAAAARRLLLQAFVAQCIDEPAVAADAHALFDEVFA